MPAPGITFSITGSKISGVSGFDHITVTFLSDVAYQSFECRATKAGAEYGLGKGALVAAFSSTPAGVERSFDVYDDYLLNGDGEYRISLFAQSTDGGWNDNHLFIPSGATKLLTADGKTFLCER